MADGLARVLSKPDFDAESFVKKQLNCSVLSNVNELESLRRQVGRLRGETSVALKKNVYKHYCQFIDTAKEISILEGEMYQMSHLLSEQKATINTITELSFADHKEQQEAEDDKQKGDSSCQLSISYLLEKVEGCPWLDKCSDTLLVHHGEVLELHSDLHTPLSSLHLFLLPNALLIASILPEIKGIFQYHLEGMYDLNDLAVVNVREGGDLSCAFKILVFPSSRLFSAASPKIKKKWMEVLDEWKRCNMPSHHRHTALTGSNPFEEGEGVGGMEEWVADAPEDLDVLVAQRDFEGAVDLVIKVHEYLNKHPNLSDVADYKRRLEHRVGELKEWLVRQLSVSAERSVRGGLRSLRKLVCQLIRLDEVSLACDLFLSNRSRVCHHVMKQLANESQALAYVSNLCECFFSNMAAICQEFKMVFENHPRCSSAFVQWCQQELMYFCGLFSKQVFDSSLPFSTTVDCVSEAKKGCRKLSDSGVEMLFVLEDFWKLKLLTYIQAAGDTHMEAIKHRTVDDRWRPVNLQTSDSLGRFEAQMREAGFQAVADYRFDDTHTYLTSNTIEFSKNYLLLARQFCLLYCPTLHACIVEGLKDILMSYASHLLKASSEPAIAKNNASLIHMNARFVATEVVVAVCGLFEEEASCQLHLLSPIQQKLLVI